MQTGEMRLQGVGSDSRRSLSKSMSVQATWCRWFGLSAGVQGSQPLYSMEEQNIYFISDPPLLMKTVRNGWASQKRKLWVSTKYIYMLDSPSVRVHIYFQCDGKEISWRHLENLYRRNKGETGLVLVLKLNYEHVRLTSFSKMRVDLATQVSTLLYKFTFH